jgi:ABC-type oligopeptide transport system substrate-binding subunit
MSRREQKPDFWGASNKKVRAEKIQIFSDLKKIYSSLQIRKIEIFYDPQKISKPVISPLQISTDFTT